ncbi:MAG: galactose mutarotase [Chitinophagaceae bacterium]|nr:MAG: galactose mutarotase [Chitinophagaceae bacterium]
MKKHLLPFIAVTLGMISCNDDASNKSTVDTIAKTAAAVSAKNWGTADEQPVKLFTLSNSKGDTVTITNYGATLVSWSSADRNGNHSSVLAGPAALDGFLQKPPYFGAIIGRYGNRIGKAGFTLGGTKYTLPANDGPNTLHGGVKGFDKVVWTAEVPDSNHAEIRFSYMSPDGDQGFPGKLSVIVIYTLTNDNEVKIRYEATTDKPTPVNLTNHAYFNLSGNADNLILTHQLMVDAERYTPVDAQLIPTGQLAPVQSTPFDFRKAETIGARIAQVNGGYDHNWVLNKWDGKLRKIAELTDSISGRLLEVSTTEPGIQFYSGNFLDGKFITADGKAINKHSALCLETQHFPDSPNKPAFPSTILEPGQTYRSETVYRLSVK